jgi:hypothetical protein
LDLIVSAKSGLFRTDCLQAAPLDTNNQRSQYTNLDATVTMSEKHNLIAVTSDQEILVYNGATNKLIHKEKIAEASAVNFSPCGKWLVWAKRY